MNIIWLRRDLRLEDNAALYYALKKNLPVLPVFIFDTNILDELTKPYDARVEFIHTTLITINQQLQLLGSGLKVFYSSPESAFIEILQEYKYIDTVFANDDYEPYARQRDEGVKHLLEKNNVGFKTFKDQCIFEKGEVVKDDGKPYSVFTPYSRKWKEKINDFYVKGYPTQKYFSQFLKTAPLKVPQLGELGFKKTNIPIPPLTINKNLISKYKEQRDFPAITGTSRLSLHLRFGTVSIRNLVKEARKLNETWLNELIWREFYMMILYHHPHVATSAFKPAYDRINWRNNEHEFEAWCLGQTGFPIVDAGMRELNATGFMHNRVRMITASFLVKDLLIDWRWGEAYFAEKLLDFDLSANNGGWQWAAGSGCDAAPYFRIFNPTEQTKKFDPEYKYIRKWVPEFNTSAYPRPIVDHKEARARTLKVYSEALTEDNQTRLF